jgi:hypothetical protein
VEKRLIIIARFPIGVRIVRKCVEDGLKKMTNKGGIYFEEIIKKNPIRQSLSLVWKRKR